MVNKQKKLFSVGFFNAGSLGTRHDEFTVMMERLSVDIMAINETWLREGEDGKAPTIHGYKLKHHPRPINIRGGRGGGVGFYIRQGVNARLITTPETPSVEQMWLSLKINQLKIAVGTAYRPPWMDVNLFIDALTLSWCSLATFDFIILTGDFNINLLLPTDNKTKLLTQIFRFGFCQVTSCRNFSALFNQKSVKIPQ